VVRLPVSVPAHTPFLTDAVGPFLAALREAKPAALRRGIRLLRGFDGTQSMISKPEQPISPGRSQPRSTGGGACLESCRASGTQSVLELGPGAASSRMAGPLFSAGYARSVEEFRMIDGVRSWLARSGG
jgi:[acyl-carrier-protein] S-malonyltransferase